MCAKENSFCSKIIVLFSCILLLSRWDKGMCSVVDNESINLIFQFCRSFSLATRTKCRECSTALLWTLKLKLKPKTDCCVMSKSAKIKNYFKQISTSTRRPFLLRTNANNSGKLCENSQQARKKMWKEKVKKTTKSEQTAKHIFWLKKVYATVQFLQLRLFSRPSVHSNPEKDVKIEKHSRTKTRKIVRKIRISTIRRYQRTKLVNLEFRLFNQRKTFKFTLSLPRSSFRKECDARLRTFQLAHTTHNRWG